MQKKHGSQANLKENLNMRCNYTQVTQKINDMTHQVEALEEVIKLQSSQMDQLRQENTTLRDHADHYDSLLKAKENELEQLTLQMQEMSDQLQYQQESRIRRGDDYEGVMKENQALQEQIQYLQEEFKSQVEQMEQKISFVMEESRVSKGRCSCGNNKDESVEELKQWLERQVQNYGQVAQNGHLEEQLGFMIKEYECLSGRMSQLENEKSKLGKDNDLLQKKQAELENDISGQLNQIYDLQNQIQENQQEMIRKNLEASEVRSRVEFLEKKCEVQEKQLEQNRVDLQEKREQLRQLKEYSARINEGLVEKQVQLNDFKQQARRWQDSEKDTQAEAVTQKMRQLHDMNSKVKAILSENDVLKSRLVQFLK